MQEKDQSVAAISRDYERVLDGLRNPGYQRVTKRVSSGS